MLNFRTFLHAFLFIFLISSLHVLHAEDASTQPEINNFIEGKHYFRISPPVATNVEEGKIEIMEIFWYGCPHCYEFEPHINSWKEAMPAEASFDRMPAVLNRGWTAHARAYYALETMSELERIHPVFFAAIHDQGRRLRDVESMARFLSQHGVEADKFKDAYDSLYVETKVKRSEQVVRQYGVSSVPQVVINGKYRTSGRDAGGFENVIRIIDMLVAKEAAVTTAAADTSE